MHQTSRAAQDNETQVNGRKTTAVPRDLVTKQTKLELTEINCQFVRFVQSVQRN